MEQIIICSAPQLRAESAFSFCASTARTGSAGVGDSDRRMSSSCRLSISVRVYYVIKYYIILYYIILYYIIGRAASGPRRGRGGGGGGRGESGVWRTCHAGVVHDRAAHIHIYIYSYILTCHEGVQEHLHTRARARQLTCIDKRGGVS
jgi:hypothetical protein